MKKLFIIATILCIAGITQAQPRERLLRHAYLRYADGQYHPVDSTVYTYGPGHGAIGPEAHAATMFDSRTDYTSQGGQWQPREATMDTFDASGRMASSTSRQYSHGRWAGSQRYLYLYDAQGDTLAQYMMLPRAYDTWDTFSARLCSYDTLQRRVTTLSWQDFGADRYAGSTLDSALYDSLGHQVKAVHLVWTSGQWQRGRANIYGCDAQGRRTSDLLLLADQGLWQPNILDSFAYDDEGRLLMRASFTRAQGGHGWKPAIKVDYRYDSRGDTTAITTREYSPGTDTIGMATTDSISYDDHHHRLTKVSWTDDNGNRIMGLYELNEYDNHELLTTCTTSVWRDFTWEPIGRTEYRYDGRGYRTVYILGSYAEGRWLPELEEHDYYEPVR